MTEKIEVRYKEILNSGSVFPLYHKYIIYTDSNGNQFIARGGPENGDGYGSRGGVNNAYPHTFGQLVTEVKEYVDDQNTPDWDPEDDDPRETIKRGDDLSEDWQKIVDLMDDFNNHFQYQYQPVGQNSNAVVDDVLKRAGLPEALADDLYNSPGSDTPFTIFLPDSLQFNLPPWLKDALAPILDLMGADIFVSGSASPLVLDLDRNGQIDLVSFENSGVHFDFWGDGFAEQTGWVAPSDGFLVRDLDNNGTIDGMHELFGSNYPLGYMIHTNYAGIDEEAGFGKLALLDSNNDGVINALDDAFGELKVWRDFNQNGVTDEGELVFLSELNIASIDVGNAEQVQWNGIINGGFGRIIEGNTISHSSTYTLTTGQSYEIVDAWFANDNQKSSGLIDRYAA